MRCWWRRSRRWRCWCCVLLAPIVLRHGSATSGSDGCTCCSRRSGKAMTRVRAGLVVFRRPRLGARRGAVPVRRLGVCSVCPATSCWSRSASTTRPGSRPLRRSCSRSTSPRCCRRRRPTWASSRPRARPCCTPAGTSGFGTGVAYGVILQAVEVTTAILMGAPALLKEGMSWREVRLRAMHAAPVKLPARPATPAGARE